MDSQIINQYLESLLLKLLELEAAKRDIKYISNKEEDYFFSVVEKSDFFYRCYRYAFKLFVIDLCKVVGDKEDRNILSFTRILLCNYRKIDWAIKPERDELNALCERVKAVRATDHYQKLKIARDKYYAHDDKNKKDFKIDVPFEKGWEINDELQDIYAIIRSHLTGVDPSFYVVPKPYYELESIHKLNKIEKYVFEEYKKDRFKEGHISTILDIINGSDGIEDE